MLPAARACVCQEGFFDQTRDNGNIAETALHHLIVLKPDFQTIAEPLTFQELIGIVDELRPPNQKRIVD